MKLRPMLPPIALSAAAVLTATSMLDGYLYEPFIVEFDDCDSLLSGLSISGRIRGSDDLCYTFELEAGESQAALLSSDSSYDICGFGLYSDPRYSGFDLGLSIALPDDAVISSKGIDFDDKGRAISTGSFSTSLYVDRIAYRFYLESFDNKQYSLGGYRTVTAEELGGELLLSLTPNMLYSDDGGDTVTYIFSSDPKDYHLESNALRQQNDIFSSCLSNSYARLEPNGESFNVYFIDRISNSICMADPGSDELPKTLGNFELGENKLIMFFGEESTAAAAIRDGESVKLIINGRTCYSFELTESEYPSIQASVSNNTVTFLISSPSISKYVILSSDGALICELETEPQYSSTVNNWYSMDSIVTDNLDTLSIGDRIYILNNAAYKAWVDIRYMLGEEANAAINSFGGGLIGHLVKITVIENGKPIASELHPIRMNISVGENSSTDVRIGWKKQS